ncbi:MAG: UDP-N-acetylglucosamine--N-acetylmuramyl-(pentapeptide) pyrophosphoryl-undecaprenol N-acetylglucosamine transferase [Candidatus Daviesbacteria bacterium]|nr:MAG: UDP-N-acetylglucosamine--N-acetylmuramyl-(pentapeptide) pyrophosphoryl-undecaprenol N-acetylglucosamine transferase [Candidatus Daviesbacteria bacterium]
MSKIILTGAHFTTAVATIQELKKYPEVELVYVGRRTTMEGDQTKSVESQILPSLGVKFIPIITGRLQRSFTPYTIPSLLKIPIGFIQAFKILLQEKPDVVVSFGGYVALPLVICAWVLSIPILIHEQTLVTGLANKISSLFADKIAVSFRQNLKTEGKYILTGNPIREVFKSNHKNIGEEYKNFFNFAKRAHLPIVVVTGGNQGSHFINQLIEERLSSLLKFCCIIHQTGDSKYQDFERLEKFSTPWFLVKKFINEEIGVVFKSADLVITRAGANTLLELAYLGKPALTIPIPYLYQDEQTKNAEFFQKLGLCQIIWQKEASGEVLEETIKKSLKNLASLTKSAQVAKEVVIPDSEKRLALEIILLGRS